MTSILLPLLLAVAVRAAPAPAHAHAHAHACQALREYDALASTVTREFYDRTFRRLDWNARVLRYRARVRCGFDASDVASTVNALLSVLHASHTAVYTAKDLEYWALESLFSQSMDAFETNVSGILPERRGGEWYARYVLPGSPADVAGVTAGDELVGLNGGDFDPLGFSAQSPSQLIVSPDGHRRRTIRLTAVHESMRKALLDATERSARILPVGERRVGYFHLWAAMGAPFLQATSSALSHFEDQRIDALVLDFRGGYGGADLRYLTRLRTSGYLARIPKYVLIDDGVRSGKEWVAAVARRDGIATLVGSRTAGAFLGGLANHLFNDKYFLYVAGREFVPPGIGPLEGIGVQPDVAVKPCPRFCRGSDPQLSAALRMIRTAPSSRAAALVWRPGPFRFGHRRRRGRLCDLDARSCLRFAPPPRLCLLALSSSPQTPSCWALGRLYQIERGARGGAWGLSFNPIAISVLQRSR